MAAPGSLWVAKTCYPETKKTKATWESIKNLPKGHDFFLKCLNKLFKLNKNS